MAQICASENRDILSLSTIDVYLCKKCRRTEFNLEALYMDTRHETHAALKLRSFLHDTRHETHAGMNSCCLETRNETFEIRHTFFTCFSRILVVNSC